MVGRTEEEAAGARAYADPLSSCAALQASHAAVSRRRLPRMAAELQQQCVTGWVLDRQAGAPNASRSWARPSPSPSVHSMPKSSQRWATRALRRRPARDAAVARRSVLDRAERAARLARCLLGTASTPVPVAPPGHLLRPFDVRLIVRRSGLSGVRDPRSASEWLIVGVARALPPRRKGDQVGITGSRTSAETGSAPERRS